MDPTVIGRLVDVNADLEQVQVRLQGRVVAQHARVWARGLTLTDPAHVATAKLLREQFREPSARQAEDAHEGLGRDLADYRAFGLTGDGQVA